MLKAESTEDFDMERLVSHSDISELNACWYIGILNMNHLVCHYKTLIVIVTLLILMYRVLILLISKSVCVI